MIIKDINLTNFGKFNHKSVSLEPGLNIIYGENEAGKTTLHTFIRGMLFGIDKQRGKASTKDLYSKYEPWENPSYYQGTMRIENDGVLYRIERVFNKESKSFKVINEDLGQELSEEEIDVLFEGLDESCYYNTISISQLGSSTDQELESILKNYAANIGSTKSMEIDIKAAYADLDVTKKKIATENRISEEEIIAKSISNAKDQLEISEREQHTIIASIEQKKSVEEGLDEKVKELSALDAKRLEELAKRNERKENLYQEVISLTSDLEKNSSIYNQAKNHRERLEEQLKEMGIDSAQTLEKVSEKVMNHTNIPIVFILLMMACIGVTAGLLIGSKNMLNIPSIWAKPGLCMAGAVIFLVLTILKYIYNKRKKEKKIEGIRDLRQRYERLEAAKQEEIYTARLVERKKENLQNLQDMIKAEEEKDLGVQDYSEELRELEEKKRGIGDEISKARWMLEQKKEKDIEIEKRIEELQHRMEKIEAAKLEIQAIEQAKENIEAVAMEIRNSFGRKLNERASYYMGQITNGKYDNINIDERLNITINGKSHLIPTSKLSKGTTEQVYMALRLAAADLIFEKDKKPILLDDAFAMYDNRRMGNTMRFMAENMDQVIMFSCHTREKLMADKLGVNYHFIRL